MFKGSECMHVFLTVPQISWKITGNKQYMFCLIEVEKIKIGQRFLWISLIRHKDIAQAKHEINKMHCFSTWLNVLSTVRVCFLSKIFLVFFVSLEVCIYKWNKNWSTLHMCQTLNLIVWKQRNKIKYRQHNTFVTHSYSLTTKQHTHPLPTTSHNIINQLEWL